MTAGRIVAVEPPPPVVPSSLRVIAEGIALPPNPALAVFVKNPMICRPHHSVWFALLALQAEDAEPIGIKDPETIFTGLTG